MGVAIAFAVLEGWTTPNSSCCRKSGFILMLQVLIVDYISLVVLRKVTPAPFRLACRHRIRVCMKIHDAACIMQRDQARGYGKSWPRSGLNAKTLARVLVGMESSANHIWNLPGNPRREPKE